MRVYRHKIRSDEVLTLSDIRYGLIVWVDGKNGREERVWSYGELLTREEHHKRKQEQAARNRAAFGDKQRSHSRKKEGHFFVQSTHS